MFRSKKGGFSRYKNPKIKNNTVVAIYFIYKSKVNICLKHILTKENFKLVIFRQTNINKMQNE